MLCIHVYRDETDPEINTTSERKAASTSTMHGEMHLEHENKCLVVVFLLGISESVPSVLDNLFLGYALTFQPGCPNRRWQYSALRQQDGPDDIHYQMLKHLPKEAVQTLLGALNDIWYSGNFPDSWHTSTVIPVPKPGKDKSDSSNYRPVALTSCICKIMERMINNRLVWYLEQNNFITF